MIFLLSRKFLILTPLLLGLCACSSANNNNNRYPNSPPANPAKSPDNVPPPDSPTLLSDTTLPDKKYTPASEVIDRESLTSFVNGARHHLEHDYETSLIDFKQEGPWRHNSIYLFILSPKGQVIFHPATPSLEGTNIIDFVDVNGVRMVEELIKTAQNGGGFVEYLWDNPEAKNGNKEAGFPKVSYSITFTKKDGTNLILGSGFYPGCQNHTINLQKEFKLWKQPSTSLPFPYLGQISLKQKAEMTLNKLGNVDFFTDPERSLNPQHLLLV